MSGFSPIIEFEIPTKKGASRINTLVGFSTALVKSSFAINQVIHYDPREDMVDGSVALVYKAGKKVFIAAEILGEKMPDGQAIINLLGGVKIKVNKNFMLGLAYHTQSQRTRSFHRNIFFSRIWNGKGKREYFGSL